MIDPKEIVAALREKYRDSGMTQQQMADEAGISQTYMADLLSGKCDVSGLSLKKFIRLFPGASLNLGGGRSIGDGNTICHHARVQSDNNFLSTDGAVEDFRRKLIDAVIVCDEISDEERGRFLRIIKGVKHE